MKNRRIVICVFIVLATMIVGVGYAAVSGSLTIMGSAEFFGYAKTATVIQEAVKFTGEPVTDKCNASISSNNLATIDVRFDDQDEDDDEFVATATYTVIYDTTDTELAPVMISADTIRLNLQDKEGGFPAGWDVSVTFGAGDAGPVELKPAETVEVNVTVTYQNQDEDSSNADNFPITIVLGYQTED